MSGTIINLIIQLIAGAIGSNVVGLVMNSMKQRALRLLRFPHPFRRGMRSGL
jgi:hypothetical protein